ncbi:hypothetical protein AX16_002622 [Volvariella volvacea WC 439]|nr:hypothetical protein AX16_002622 [Volvariella volvacea WC 439]
MSKLLSDILTSFTTPSSPSPSSTRTSPLRGVSNLLFTNTIMAKSRRDNNEPIQPAVKPLRIMASGTLFLTHTLSLPSYPGPSSVVRAHSVEKTRGGSANVLLSLLTQFPGVEACLVASLGGNDEARMIQRDLENEGVSTRYCKIWRDAGVPSAWILHSAEDSTRTVINHNPLPDITHEEFVSLLGPLLAPENYPQLQSPTPSPLQSYASHNVPATSPSATPRPSQSGPRPPNTLYNPHSPAPFDWLHFEGRSVKTTLNNITGLDGLARERKWRSHCVFSVDVGKKGRQGVEALIPHADVLFVNKYYAQSISPHYASTPRAFLLSLTSMAPPHALLVAHWGTEGSAVLSLPTKEYFQSSGWVEERPIVRGRQHRPGDSTGNTTEIVSVRSGSDFWADGRSRTPSSTAFTAASPSHSRWLSENSQDSSAFGSGGTSSFSRSRSRARPTGHGAHQYQRSPNGRGYQDDDNDSQATETPRGVEDGSNEGVVDEAGSQDAFIAGMIYALSRRIVPGLPYTPAWNGEQMSGLGSDADKGRWRLDECLKFATELAGRKARRKGWDGLADEMAGCLVCWGLGEKEAKAFVKDVVGKAPGIEVAPLKEAETEELEFVVDPIENTRLQGDLIILGQSEPPNEEHALPKNLPAMAFPKETLLARDVPDFYWTEPELEKHFKSLSDALEVKQRTMSVNDKITYAAEAQSVLRQLLTESSSHRMELVIIALIAVEVVIALIRDGPELWEMVAGREEGIGVTWPEKGMLELAAIVMQSSEYSYPWPQPSIAYPQYHTSSPATSNPSLAPSPWSFEHAPLPPPYEHAPPSAPPLSSPWDPQIPSLAAVRQRTQSLRETHTSTRSFDANYLPQRLPRGAAPPSAALPQADANLFRSSSAAASLQPPTDQRLRTKSDVGQKPLPPLPAELSGASLHRNTSVTSTTSTASFYPPEPEHYYDEYDTAAIDQVDAEIERVAADLAGISLDTEEALLEFQKGELKPEDEEWHKMAPPAALEALGDKEVQRQSVMFEVFKSERDYVADLEAVSSVIIRPLVQSAEDYSKPPIIKREELDSFIQQVFGNFAEIMGFHQVMLGALFARQREQHPLVQSIADLILDLVVRDDFRTAYEVYIKHYPLAESRHKRELDRNPAYKEFLDNASSNPKIRKRDLLTFLSRPVTRLPRLNLLLEQILKKTEQEYQHPDTDTLPIILGILKEVLKSTQPGIEAAENKVKLWEIRDSLLYQKGEIINMDLNDEHRSLVYTSPIFRNDSEWTSLNLTLLDNYLIFIREEKGQGGKIRRYMASRPLPVLYLTLGQFDGPVENRKERTEDGGLFDRYRDVPVYPFVISHASSRSLRRYVLYVASEALRKKWYDAFRDTIGLAKARQEANLWFNPQAISKRSFRLASASNAYVPGRVLNAAPFSVGGQDYIAIGCQAGVYVSRRGEEKYYKVFNLPNPTEIVAVQTSGNQVFNKLLIQYENQVISFSLDVVAKFSQKSADNKMLTASSERVAGQDSSVLLFRHVQIGKRMLLLYTSKRTFSVSPSLNVLEVVDATKQGRGKSFRQHGEVSILFSLVYNGVYGIWTAWLCS